MKRTSNESAQQSTKKQGKLKLQYNKIKKGDVIAICKDGKDGFTESEVNSNTQIHQKTMSPLSPDGDFRLELSECMMFSNILLSRFSKTNEKTGQIENQATLKTFMDIYGDYAVLDSNGNHTTDEIGDSYTEAFQLIDESIAESLDADPVHKKRIFGLLKLGKQQKAALEAPTMDAMEPFLKRATDEDKSSRTYGEEDMSKSPTGAFQLWIGKPQVTSITDFKIPGTDLVIWTRIYDHTGDRISSKPISSWDHLMKFIYEKGDSQTKGKRPFRLKATAETLAPSTYFNSEKKVGRSQYKLSELHIYEVDYAKPRDTMSNDEIAFQRTLKMKALNRFVTNPQPEVNEESQQQSQLSYPSHQQPDADQDGYYQYDESQQQGSVNQQQQQDSDGNNYDALIDEDQQQITKKPRTV